MGVPPPGLVVGSSLLRWARLYAPSLSQSASRIPIGTTSLDHRSEPCNHSSLLSSLRGEGTSTTTLERPTTSPFSSKL